MATCRMCLQEATLIEAHIIPKCLYDKGSATYMYQESSPHREQRSSGCYDPTILCHPCDQKLGILDDYAKSILVDKVGIKAIDIYDPSSPVKKIYRLTDDNGCKKLILFFISVLWRASISNYKDFADVDLGTYEDEARNALINEDFDYKQFFSVSICFLKNKPNGLINTIPKKISHKDVDFYRMLIASHAVIIRCDKKLLADGFTQSKGDDILMIEDDFRNNPEYQWIYQMLNERATSTKAPLTATESSP